MNEDKKYHLTGWIRFRQGDEDLGIPLFHTGTNPHFVPETNRALAIVRFHEFYNEQNFRLDFDLPPEWKGKVYSEGDRVPIPFRIRGQTYIIDKGDEKDLGDRFRGYMRNSVIGDLAGILRSMEQISIVGPSSSPIPLVEAISDRAAERTYGRLYRGAAPGTWGSNHDARVTGFAARAPSMPASFSTMIQHISRGLTTSPFISFVRSYAIAQQYALEAGRTLPTPQTPGIVYEIDINMPLPAGIRIIDPIVDIAQVLSTSAAPYHTGDMNLLIGIVDPVNHSQYLTKPELRPPGSTGSMHPPLVTLELETMVRVLRDTEVLAVGQIPATYVVARYEVY